MGEADPATQAFTRLEGEMALMRRAVEHLATEKAEIVIPDYSTTLGEMAKRLGAIAQGLVAVADKPAMQLTPEGLAARIEAAAEKSRASDKATLREAREAHQEAARIIHGLVGAVRGTDEQRKHLIWAACGGLAAGCLLWAILPGVVLRALPDSWHMPESMAAHIIGEPTLWEAGIRMMRAGSEEAWQALANAAEMLRDNREAIEACEQTASKAKEPVRCSIKIRR
jgi:hypothetical protein